jgi:hypothetical protein
METRRLGVLFAVCALAVLCVLAVAAQEQKGKKDFARVLYAPPSFYKGESFIEMSEADRMLYTSGLMDGFFASTLFGATDETVATLTSCTKDMDSKQLSAIITKHVKDHPESWHVPLSIEAYNALSSACHGELKDHRQKVALLESVLWENHRHGETG